MNKKQKKILIFMLGGIVLLAIICICLRPQSDKSYKIKAQDGYFDINAEDFLQEINSKIKNNNGNYPKLPAYSSVEPFGNLTEYCSFFDSGGYLRVQENQSHKVVAATILLDMNSATKTGANYSGYYFGTIGNIINSNSGEQLKSIEIGNIAENGIQSVSCGNFFCVVVKENGILQCRMYPLDKQN